MFRRSLVFVTIYEKNILHKMLGGFGEFDLPGVQSIIKEAFGYLTGNHS